MPCGWLVSFVPAPFEKRSRFFNTTGPCNPQDHSMLPVEERLVGALLNRYIGNKQVGDLQ